MSMTPPPLTRAAVCIGWLTLPALALAATPQGAGAAAASSSAPAAAAASPAPAAPATPSPLQLEDVALEGQLRFLPLRPDPHAYRYEASATLDALSLKTGVISLRTCHWQLDPNRRVVVAFNRERLQHLEVLESSGVGRAWVEGHRVELADVRRGGHVCIGLRTQALESSGSGRWTLYAGPLMRRYLDGYLPMNARLSLSWPAGLLTVEQTFPPTQPGVHLTQDGSGATLDLTFAGRLSAVWQLRELRAQ